MEAGLTGSSLVGVWDGLPIRCGTGVDQSIGSGANGLDFSPFPGTPERIETHPSRARPKLHPSFVV